MKLCFITNDLSDTGGQQRVTAKVLNMLAKDHSVSVLFYSDYDKASTLIYELDSNIQIIWDKSLVRQKTKRIKEIIFTKFYQYIYQFKSLDFAIKNAFSKRELKAFESILNPYQFDIVIGISPFASALVGLLDLNSKKVGWLHNTYERYFETANDYAWNLGNLYSYAFSKLDCLIVLTNKSKENYQSKVNTRVEKIYNPMSFYSDTKASQEDKPILFVGRISYITKGLEMLIESLTYLKETHEDFVINIVGDGPDFKRLENDIETNNLSENVRLIGEQKDVLPYYLNASYFVLPSRIEGFGLVVTEAMECGLPVISYKTDGPSEIIQDEVNGFLIDNYDSKAFADKMAFLLNNEKVAKDMGQNAVKRVQDFKESVIKEEWNQLLSQVYEGN
ncbi:glycosyltransferase [Aerococcus kribbianus]|uniref:Glycosyltransferase n=1 Tax=Aerococcus kribbianus TaxID=2999064 RepID=A0A9X3FUJ8_9LACT|nr:MULTISPECIES: glycosyltransferase [unclassified Aerococcus]MCZ0717176.1 glycosyltransferase [Aerococcus sp. YH-aer221]MCZ0725464.1 glycosyltransferase [Aerococcus sp. YH-aer222]